MGKAKKKNKHKERAHPTSGRPVKPPSDPQLAALRSEKVLPAVETLQSAESKGKVTAATSIENLVHDERCRKLLLRERIVGIVMEQTINDSDLEVSAAGWSILATLAEEEEADFSVHLYREDILTPLWALFDKVKAIISQQQVEVAKNQQKVWTALLVSSCNLLSSLAAADQEIMDKILKSDVCITLVALLQPSSSFSQASLSREALLFLLHTLTEDNEGLSNAILEHLFEILNPYSHSRDSSGVLANGILYNLRYHLGMGPAVIQEILGRLIMILDDATTQYDMDDRGFVEPLRQGKPNALKTLEMLIETVSTVATDILEDQEEGRSRDEEEQAFEGFADVDDEVMADDEDDDEYAPTRDGITVNGNDTGMNQIEEGDPKRQPPRGTYPEPLVLIATTFARKLIHFAEAPIKSSEKNVLFSHTVAALNNIAWMVAAEFSKSPQRSETNDEAAAQGDPTVQLARQWPSIAGRIWREVIAPVISSSSTSVALASQISTLAWATASSVKGNIELTEEREYERFMALYEASKSTKPASSDSRKYKDQDQMSDAATLGVKSIGVLGALAQSNVQSTVPRTAAVTAFLLNIVEGLPRTKPEDAIEALNALFDIFADAAYVYDEPVFVQGNLLTSLQGVVDKVKKMAKNVNPAKMPGLRDRADEAVVNLKRFLDYKRDEAGWIARGR